jgi:hypothetical protein
MNGKFPHNDQAASALGPSSVISHMEIAQSTPFGKIGPVGQKTNPIGQGYMTYLEGLEKFIKHISN